MLRHCLVGRFANFLRHVPPDVISEAAKEFDDEIRDTLFAVLKQPDLSAAEKERALRAASLPLHHGGLRLQSAQEIAPLAFFCGQRGSATRPRRVPRGTCLLRARVFERDSHPPDPGIVDYADVHRAVHWGFNWVNDLDAGQEKGRTERPRDPIKLPRAPTDMNDRYHKLQRTLTEQHQRRQAARLMRDVPPTGRAALRSAVGSGSSALFIAVPELE